MQCGTAVDNKFATQTLGKIKPRYFSGFILHLIFFIWLCPSASFGSLCTGFRYRSSLLTLVVHYVPSRRSGGHLRCPSQRSQVLNQIILPHFFQICVPFQTQLFLKHVHLPANKKLTYLRVLFLQDLLPLTILIDEK